MRWILAFPVFVLSLFLSLVLAFNGGAFDLQIRQRVHAATGGALQVGPVRLKALWPLRLSLGPSQYTTSGLNLSMKSAQLQLNSLSKPYLISISINAPALAVQGSLEPGAPEKAAGASERSRGPLATQVLPIRLTLKISDGSMALPYAQVRQLSAQFEQKLFLVSPARLELQAGLETAYFPGQIPLQVSGENLTLGLDAIKAEGLKLSLAGLQALVQGASLLADGRHRWVLAVEAPDLSRLPKPTAALGVKDWQGAIRVKAEVIKNSAKEGWRAEGQGAARAVQGQFDFKDPLLNVQGLATADADFNFIFANQNLELLQFKGAADLGAAHVTVSEWLDKPERTPLRARGDFKLSGTNLGITAFEGQLAQLISRVSGQMNMKGDWPADLIVAVPKVNLAGLEALFPPLAKTPVRGEAEIRFKLSGPLFQPLQTRVAIENLRLSQLSSRVKLKTENFEVEGPVSTQLSVIGEIDKGQPKKLEAQGQLDLKAATLKVGPLHKAAASEFALEFKALNRGTSLNIQNLDLKSFFGQIQVKGRVHSFDDKSVDLKVAAKPLNLSELRMAVPEFRERIPKGEVSGQVRLSGKIPVEKAWFDWPLKVSGDLAASIPEYHFSEVAEATTAEASPEKNANAGDLKAGDSSFLPKGFLTENLDLTVRVAANDIKRGTLLLKQVSANGQIAGGHFKGAVGVGEVFGGRTDLTALDVPLIQKETWIQGLLTWSDVSVEGAMAFVKPEYRAMASGKSAGRADFATLLPSETQFMSRLKVRGEINADPMTLNAVKIGEFLNSLTAKLPFKTAPAKLDPIRGVATAQFEVANQVVTVGAMEARDQDGSQLNVKGKVVLADMQGDFVGNFAWAQSGVKGCLLEGNADGSGRMVIPLSVKGDLLNPGLSPLSDIISKVGARALECEKNKLVDKVKQEGTKAVEKEAKKLLNSLFDKK